jgi:uncharacterized protein (TIGR02996 family)
LPGDPPVGEDVRGCPPLVLTEEKTVSKKKGSPPSQGAALEAALVAQPDDLGAHRAYADWLSEQPDPSLAARGELIQVQLALEGEVAGGERQKLERRQRELLEAHVADWLGDLADHLLDNEGVEFTFARGWLDALALPRIREDLSAALAAAPQARLLRSLIVADRSGEPLDRVAALETRVLAGVAWYEEEEDAALDPLEGSDNLANLRTFQLGDIHFGPTDVSPRLLPDLLSHMPRLEELRLYLFSLDEDDLFRLEAYHNVRVLQLCGVFDYPLSLLAENPSLGKLAELHVEPVAPGGHMPLDPYQAVQLLRPGVLPALGVLRLRFCDAGDSVCEEIAGSGILGRLRTLDLQFGGITDEGARALAGSPDLRRLKTLDVSYNSLSEEGVARLKAAGVEVLAEPQLPPEEEGGQTEEA